MVISDPTIPATQAEGEKPSVVISDDKVSTKDGEDDKLKKVTNSEDSGTFDSRHSTLVPRNHIVHFYGARYTVIAT